MALCKLRPYQFIRLCIWGLAFCAISLLAIQHLSSGNPLEKTSEFDVNIIRNAQFGRRIDGFADEKVVVREMDKHALEEELARLLAMNHWLARNVSAALARIDRLEKEAGQAGSNTTFRENVVVPLAAKESVGPEGKVEGRPAVIQVREEECSGPFPAELSACEGKMKWMKNFWKSDPCYADNGVDGSQCSFYIYLSEIEKWCPVLKSREGLKKDEEKDKDKAAEPSHQIFHKTELNTDLQSLLGILGGEKLTWVRQRITRMWPDWQKSANQLAVKLDTSVIGRPVKRVYLHMGLLSERVGFKIAETAFHGGPLGELVQWSDLLASLHILGHQIVVTYETPQLAGYFKKFKSSACPVKNGDSLVYDIVFIDIVGLREFKKAVGGAFQMYKCHFRILDSFGTEPEFNLKSYRRPGQSSWGREWGNWDMNPRQFWTMFPHSPDNSFLGFIVERKLDPSEKLQKGRQVLVYGKELDMWKDSKAFLDTVSQFGEVHATIGTTKTGRVDASLMPEYVINHGVLDGNGIQALLRETKVFVGLGFPYEGPAPLEAIANGCFFLNPKFDPPLNRMNTAFFKSKPTLRAMTSQHPYAEVFIGKPHVHTVNIKNLGEVKTAMDEMMRSSVDPYIPYEMTHSGLLERLTAYLANQDFCSESSPQWPPLSALETVFSQPGHSCKDTCLEKDMVCEPEFFPFLNKKETFDKIHVECSSVTAEPKIDAPSFNREDWTCYTQSEPMLFSCVGEEGSRSRICPCRKYQKEQIALCLECR